MFTKVLDKDTLLAEKIWTLFQEQGIMIVSVLKAIGMAVGVLVEVLLPGGGGTDGTVGKPPPKDEKGLKEWIKSKLKALSSSLGRLGMKATEALPGIIGVILSWILNKAADVVGWVSQNLWALVVGIGGLLCAYMVTKKQRCFHYGNDIQLLKHHKAPPIAVMLKVIKVISSSTIINYVGLTLNFAQLCMLFSLHTIMLSQSLTCFDLLWIFHCYFLHLILVLPCY